MSSYGTWSKDLVTTLFNTSSDTYSILKASSEATNYKAIKSAINILKSNIASCSSEEDKEGLQTRLDTIMEQIKSQVSSTSGTSVTTEESDDEESSLLASLGIGKTIDTLV